MRRSASKDSAALLAQAAFHYTPKHPSWLNRAKTETGILDRQYLNGHLPDRARLAAEVSAWQWRPNRKRHGIEWTLTRQDGDTQIA